MLHAVVAHGVAPSLLAPMALRHRMDLWMVGMSKTILCHICVCNLFLLCTR